MKNPGPDDIFLLVMGAAFVAAVRLFSRVTQGPRVVLSSRQIVLHKFFGKQKWQISDIGLIASFPTTIHPRSAKDRKLCQYRFTTSESKTGEAGVRNLLCRALSGMNYFSFHFPKRRRYQSKISKTTKPLMLGKRRVRNRVETSR